MDGKAEPDFDQIIEKIGNAGLFQKRFNIIFNVVLSVLLAMTYMNLVMSMAVPDHWCHVPGREGTNYTLEEWKSLTIPMEKNAYGQLGYSMCRRFSISPTNNTIIARNYKDSINCDKGWEFDRTWYDETIPSQNNWVCDDELVPANVLAVSRAGEVIGSLIFSYLSDNIGRMPVFFVTLISIIIGRGISVFISPWLYVFYAATFIGSLSSASVFQGPFVIAMEISAAKHRALIGLVGYFTWSLGMVLLPLIMWGFRDWMPFMLVTTFPVGLFLFSRPWFVESPRWLISKGKTKQCIQQLEKIAKCNNTELPNDIAEQLTIIVQQQGDIKTHTILSLFSSLRLAKNTLIIIYCTATNYILYMCLAINASIMTGNPYLQYAYQSLAELPSQVVGQYISHKFGRRWVLITGFILSTLGCVIVLFLVQDISNDWIISIICIFLKFSTSLSLFAISMFNIEIYPTCARQTGTSLGSVTGSLFSILSPYIITLGVSVNPLIPYITYTIILMMGTISAVFLPETRGQQLPETLKDAAVFGADQDIWGRIKYKKDML